MPKLKVFVSFSTQDEGFVQRLFFRLKAQPVELWDYSREGHEIPGGAEVMGYLQERIALSDVFIPILSANSLKSNYIKGEVRYALGLARNSKLRIIPIMLAHFPLESALTEPYLTLAQFRFYKVKTALASVEERVEARSSLEETVRRLCYDLGIEYAPLPIEDPRLPFMDKFEKEMVAAEECATPEARTQDEDTKLFLRPERQRAIFQRLSDARNEVAAALNEGSYGLALTRINFFIATCEYELPKVRFYYPYVVKAICLICGGHLLQATDVLLALMKHPESDENVYAALGCIKHQQGAFREALECYREAGKKDPSDPAAKYGMLLNALLSNSAIEVDRLLHEIEHSEIHVPEDRVKVESLKAYAFTATGRIRRAIDVYEMLIGDGHRSASILVNFAAALCDPRSSQPEHALDLLERFEKEFEDDADYLHRLASLSFQLNQMEKAMNRFQRLVALHPNRRQYRIDAAQVFYARGDRTGARQMVLPVLDRNVFGLPTTPNDYFCDGFENWILGRRDRADYDFERSGQPPGAHYRFLLPE